ncbi:hypothetical protein NPIL_322271 [Nephila pilipes]|uniref:Uncharacterized protein n=1 Tax=Nephila pilipes TaxID=299642 RepID=A0A8X6MBA0_NEPPI|nr:hypothetical protein NPIL_104271 [Nephila pilipes]GFS45706.1 hypothetical protein NPIL_260901 [Nephila pilipes]GFS80023.1 hypothetical protein NPIL_166111 [Nephila pilipes]GFT77412.1 hypothetical protein NPIL_322271 [Nephila pilipes]
MGKKETNGSSMPIEKNIRKIFKSGEEVTMRHHDLKTIGNSLRKSLEKKGLQTNPSKDAGDVHLSKGRQKFYHKRIAVKIVNAAGHFFTPGNAEHLQGQR